MGAPPGVAAPADPIEGLASAAIPVAAPSLDLDAVRTSLVQHDTANIRALLNRYGRGYEQLDAGEVAAIWPGVDQPALRRAFDALASQQVLFEGCRLTLAGTAATASCRGVLRVVRRVGGSTPMAQPMQWTFRLARTGQDWTIASVRSTPLRATP